MVKLRWRGQYLRWYSIRYGIAYLVTCSTLLPLVVLIYPLVVLVCPLVVLVCQLVVLVCPFVCLLVVLVCSLVVSVCPIVVLIWPTVWPLAALVVLSVSLFITDREKLCFSQFSSRIYLNTKLAAFDLFHMFTQ